MSGPTKLPIPRHAGHFPPNGPESGTSLRWVLAGPGAASSVLVIIGLAAALDAAGACALMLRVGPPFDLSR